jgi:predicted small lipoprotein YifL
MFVRFTFLMITVLVLTACGRAGPMLRPEQGVTVMKEADKPAAQAPDKPFVLDKLL